MSAPETLRTLIEQLPALERAIDRGDEVDRAVLEHLSRELRRLCIESEGAGGAPGAGAAPSRGRDSALDRRLLETLLARLRRLSGRVREAREAIRAELREIQHKREGLRAYLCIESYRSEQYLSVFG